MFAPRGIMDIAWNAKGTELCAMTLTDVHWLSVTPLELFQTAAGENPVGIACEATEGGWAIAKDRKLTEWVPAKAEGSRFVRVDSQFTLSEAKPGQGTRTALAMAGDGRMAVYCGKRIQFIRQRQPAALSTSVVADGGDGFFQEIFWDQPGRLLGVSFTLPAGGVRLETWETTTNFPPECRACAPVVLDCQGVVPANDGRHWIARGGRRGLWEFDPAHGTEINLDTSSAACQTGPFVCTSNGSLVAMIVDHTIIRLLALPTGTFFADLYSPRQAGLTDLAWDTSGQHLASVTDDGFIQVWSLSPWREWLAVHGLQK
jgi:hypothetical protein